MKKTNDFNVKRTGRIIADLIDSYFDGQETQKEMLKTRARNLSEKELEKIWDDAVEEKEALTKKYYEEFANSKEKISSYKEATAQLRAQHLYLLKSMERSEITSIEELKEYIETMELGTLAYCTIDALELLIFNRQKEEVPSLRIIRRKE